MSLKYLGLLALGLSACGVEPSEGNGPWSVAMDAAPPPPALSVTGSCPGTVVIDVDGATPGGTIALLSGVTGGTSVVPAGPCAGHILDIGSPTLRALTPASSMGGFSVSPTLGAAPCGASVQVLDVSTCIVSSPERLGGVVSQFVGGTSTSWVDSSYFRGNRFENVAGGTIDEFSVYLGLGSSCALDFYVHSRVAPWVGNWTLEATNTVQAPPGTTLRSSGPMGVTMVPGREYSLGVGWNCAGRYFEGGSSATTVTAVGLHTGTTWDNTYVGSSGYLPPNLGNRNTIYYQQHVTY
jgi:hypothetical protein